MLLASGQWKPSETNKMPSKPEKPSNLFVEEVVINDAPMSARNYLTRSSTQDEISKMSGASVSTRGRYMSQAETEKSSNSSTDKPLHLHIQGVNEQDVKVAVGRIMHLIMEHTHRKNQPHQKFRGHKANSNSGHHERNSSKTGPPPKPQTETFASKGAPTLPPQQTIYREKVFLPINAGLDPVEVRIRLLGENGTNMKYIEDETGISVLLCGIGSGMLDAKTQQEIPEPLHFYIEHPNADQFNQAKDFVVNLAQTILTQMQQEQQQIQPQQHPPPVTPMPQEIVATARPPPPVGPQLIPPPPSHLPAGLSVNGSNLIQHQPTLQAQIAPYAPQVVPPPASQLPPSSLASLAAAQQPTSQVTAYPPPQQNTSLVLASHPVVNPSIAASQVAEITQTPAASTQVYQISVPGAVSGTHVVSQQLVQTSSGPQLVQIPHGSQIVSTPEGPRLVTFAPATVPVSATLPIQPGLPGAAPELQASVAGSAPHAVSTLAPQTVQYISNATYPLENNGINSGSTVLSSAPTAQTTSITYYQPSAAIAPDSSTGLVSSATPPQAAALAVPPPTYAPPLSVPVQQPVPEANPAQLNYAQVPLSHAESYQVPISAANANASIAVATCTTSTLPQQSVSYHDPSQQIGPDWRSYSAPRVDVPTQNFVDIQQEATYNKTTEAVIPVANKDSLLPWAQYPQSSEEVEESALRNQAVDPKASALYAFPPRLQRPEAHSGIPSTATTSQEREVSYQPSTTPSPYTQQEIVPPQAYWQTYKRGSSPPVAGICPDAKAPRSLLYKDELMLESQLASKDQGLHLPYLVEKPPERLQASPDRVPYTASYPPTSAYEGSVGSSLGALGPSFNKGISGESTADDGAVDPQWKWSSQQSHLSTFQHSSGPAGGSSASFPPPYFERPPSFNTSGSQASVPTSYQESLPSRPYGGGPPRENRPRRFFHNSNRWRKNPKFRKP